MASVRNLDYIRGKDARLYEALVDILQQHQNVAEQTNASGQGQPSAPPAIQGLKVTGQNGHFQIAIQDQGPIYRDVHYYVEHSDNPNFTNPHVIHLGHTRNHSVFLGDTKRYWRAYSSYASSPPSPAVYHGSPVAPLAVQGGGTVGAPAFLESEGSGTGDAGVGLSGPGPVPFRSSTGAAPPRGTQGKQAGAGPVSPSALGLPQNTTPFGGIVPASTGPAPAPPSGGITALTGDVTATGPGSAAATLANSGVTAGAYTNADITVDAKGRVTVAANGTAASSPATAVPLVESGSGAVGTATKYAREDHVHPAAGGTSVYFGQVTQTIPSITDQITLGSTPLAGSPIVFIAGAYTKYTISGSVLTLLAPVSSGDISVFWATANSTPGGISLSYSGGSAPTLRGTAIDASINNSYTISLPAGTLAGDLAILFCGHAYALNLPSGWTSNDNLTGSYWNGAVFSKILDAGDISTGSVTVTAVGTYDGAIALAVMVGGTAGIRETDATRNGSSATSRAVSTIGSIPTTDLLLYFGSNRNSSTDTVDRGTMQRQADDGSAGSGCLYSEVLSGSGSVTATFSYSPSSGADYQAIVAVKGV